MSPRYSLRFESGARAGETVPLSGAKFTIGRRAGNSLQLEESSVSGRHAELELVGDEARVRDLGSTNGTFLDGRRIDQARLGHGARLTFGSLEMTLLDAELPAASFRAADSVGAQRAEEQPAATVSAEMLARAGKRSRLATWLLVGAALLAAALWWATRGGSGPVRGPSEAAPVDLPGNLLAGSFSFESAREEPTADWHPLEGSDATFAAHPRSRRSGGVGLGVELAPGEQAGHASPRVAFTSAEGLEALAHVRVAAPLQVRLGIELFPAGAAADAPRGQGGVESTGSVVIWGAAPPPATDFVEARVRTSVPDGFRSARVLLRAIAPGERAEVEADPESDAEQQAGALQLDVDDVSLVAVDAPHASLRSDLFELVPLGDPPASAVLLRAGLPVVGELRISSPTGEAGDERLPLEVSAGAQGPSFTLPAGARLRLRLEARARESGWATLGADGYVRRSVDFESANARALLAGEGLELFGIFFDPPLALEARAEGEVFQVAALAAGAPRTVVLRTGFADERVQAGEIARRAEAAQRAGAAGEALRAWDDLLSTMPFHSELVQRAESARSKLAREGLTAVRTLAAEHERARFFRLAELFRTTREAARELALSYAGTEVEHEAGELLAAVEADLSELEAKLVERERDRLRAIQAGLSAGGSPLLAAEVGAYLETLPGPVRPDRGGEGE